VSVGVVVVSDVDGVLVGGIEVSRSREVSPTRSVDGADGEPCAGVLLAGLEVEGVDGVEVEGVEGVPAGADVDGTGGPDGAPRPDGDCWLVPVPCWPVVLVPVPCWPVVLVPVPC
jgi:hypothetical protein